MTTKSEAKSSPAEILTGLIQVELDPKKLNGYEYLRKLIEDLGKPETFVNQRERLLKPIGGNPNPNVALPKTKEGLLWNFPYGRITPAGLKALNDYYQPRVNDNGKIELVYPQRKEDQLRFIPPQDIRTTDQSLLLNNSVFEGLNGDRFQSIMVVNTTVPQLPSLEHGYEAQVEHYDEALRVALETGKLGGRGSIFCSSGSDGHFQYITSDQKVKLNRERFSNEYVLTSKQIIELECKATEMGYYYVILIAEGEDGNLGFTFTMPDLTNIGSDRVALSALDYKNFNSKQKAAFLALWTNKPGCVEVALRCSVNVIKTPALQALIDVCEDEDVRIELESDVVQNSYDSVPQYSRPMTFDQALSLMQSCRIGAASPVAHSAILSTQSLRRDLLLV
jgi:hypothetical protein